MMMAQASAVDAGWLQNAWIAGVVLLGLTLSPLVNWLISGRKQRREVTQGQEYVTQQRCDMLTAHRNAEQAEFRRQIEALAGRLTGVEAHLERSIRELRSDIATPITGMRADIMQLVKAVGQLEGRVGQLQNRMEVGHE